MRLCSIASGSSGNCIYVGTEETHVLVDVGIAGKRVLAGLSDLELSLDDVHAILVTHEHADHIHGLGILERKKRIPIYASHGTISYLKETKDLGTMEGIEYVEVSADEPFAVRDLIVDPMTISHDAREPLAFRFGNGGSRAAVCTDIGEFTDYTVDALRDMDCILLEANHDIRMLQAGPYPYPLKQRILGEKGHLSNDNAGKLLSLVASDRLQHILLGHLSRENNLPELAYETVRVEVDMGDNPYHASDFDLKVASRSCPSEIFEF